jgi:hypothetical protein
MSAANIGYHRRQKKKAMKQKALDTASKRTGESDAKWFPFPLRAISDVNFEVQLDCDVSERIVF